MCIGCDPRRAGRPAGCGGAPTDPELISGRFNSVSNFTVQGHVAPEEENMDFEAPRITAGYFATLRQPLLAGREFTAADTKTSSKVAVVNLTFAKRFYGSPQNAIGRLLAEGAGDKIKPDITIIGVAGDVKHSSLHDAPRATVYQSYLQMTHPKGLRIYVLTGMDAASEESAVRGCAVCTGLTPSWWSTACARWSSR